MKRALNKNGTRVEELPIQIRTAIQEALIELEQKAEAARGAQNQLMKIISGHNEKRPKLLLRRLNEAGVGWCAQCENVVKLDTLGCVLTSGRERWDSGHHEGGYGYKPFKRVLQTCETCRQKLLARNNSYGPWDSLAKDQSRFFARDVKPNDPQLAGIPIKNLPGLEFEKIAREFGVPPLIETYGEHLHVGGTGIPPFAEIPRV